MLNIKAKIITNEIIYILNNKQNNLIYVTRLTYQNQKTQPPSAK